MTTIRRDNNDTPFSDWIRNEPGLDSIKERLSVVDTDYWIHRYRAHTDKIGERAIDSIMCVELKTNEAELRFAQRDTLRLVAAYHRQVAMTKDGRIKTARLDMGNEVRRVRMYGYFLLRLHGNRPDESAWIEWHGRKINIQMLIEILRFDRDPRTLRCRSERRHHTASKKQKHPDLFAVQK